MDEIQTQSLIFPIHASLFLLLIYSITKWVHSYKPPVNKKKPTPITPRPPNTRNPPPIGLAASPNSSVAGPKTRPAHARQRPRPDHLFRGHSR
ncbi:hypothetical protein ACS0TY_006380 [Phlomoides rotata]